MGERDATKVSVIFYNRKIQIENDIFNLLCSFGSENTLSDGQWWNKWAKCFSCIKCSGSWENRVFFFEYFHHLVILRNIFKNKSSAGSKSVPKTNHAQLSIKFLRNMQTRYPHKIEQTDASEHRPSFVEVITVATYKRIKGAAHIISSNQFLCLRLLQKLVWVFLAISAI